jgi:hypothetical protein
VRCGARAPRLRPDVKSRKRCSVWRSIPPVSPSPLSYPNFPRKPKIARTWAAAAAAVGRDRACDGDPSRRARYRPCAEPLDEQRAGMMAAAVGGARSSGPPEGPSTKGPQCYKDNVPSTETGRLHSTNIAAVPPGHCSLPPSNPERNEFCCLANGRREDLTLRGCPQAPFSRVLVRPITRSIQALLCGKPILPRRILAPLSSVGRRPVVDDDHNHRHVQSNHCICRPDSRAKAWSAWRAEGTLRAPDVTEQRGHPTRRCLAPHRRTACLAGRAFERADPRSNRLADLAPKQRRMPSALRASSAVYSQSAGTKGVHGAARRTADRRGGRGERRESSTCKACPSCVTCGVHSLSRVPWSPTARFDGRLDATSRTVGLSPAYSVPVSFVTTHAGVCRTFAP